MPWRTTAKGTGGFQKRRRGIEKSARAKGPSARKRVAVIYLFQLKSKCRVPPLEGSGVCSSRKNLPSSYKISSNIIYSRDRRKRFERRSRGTNRNCRIGVQGQSTPNLDENAAAESKGEKRNGRSAMQVCKK